MKRLYLIVSLVFGYCLFFPNCKPNEKFPDDTFIHDNKMTLGTYDAAPRLYSGRADLDKLVEQLKDLNANTYNWLIWKDENDWDDLKLFLPMALKNQIAVWVTVVPPSESRPKTNWNSEPFGLDYVRWSEEIAKLSTDYPNLVAFSIDDFVHNLAFYTPEYVGEMVNKIDSINPSLQFIPCCYYRQITVDFAQKYAPMLDGILFPYRAESEGANLKNPGLVEREIASIRNIFKGFKKQMPTYIDVYLTAHSSLGATTPSYVQEVIRSGKKYADGVMIYTHPNPVIDPDKYQIVKAEFGNITE